jgi:hypothetical protein
MKRKLVFMSLFDFIKVLHKLANVVEDNGYDFVHESYPLDQGDENFVEKITN